MKVIFRKWRGSGGIIALFPEEPAYRVGHLILSYEHVGQHSAADYGRTVDQTEPATPDEYAELNTELRQIGYSDLQVVERRTQRDFETCRRRAQKMWEVY